MGRLKRPQIHCANLAGMRLRALLVLSCAGAISAGASTSKKATAPETARPQHAKPDVFLITLDTLRADHVGCYGDKQAQTPALDSLARDGIRFENAFTVSPITNTSHASILTGLYPSNHGVMDFANPVRPGAVTLAQALKEQGYVTAAFIGAVILDSKTLAPGLDRGFDFYDNFPQNLPKSSSRYGRVERRGMNVAHRAEKWLGQHSRARAPRFVWVHLYDPHDPYDPPPPYAQRYAGRLYDGEIAYADSALAELLAFLKKSGDYQRSLIVAVGDHGEGLGEHNEETHGIFLYDSTLRVPLLVKLPWIQPQAGSPLAGPLIMRGTVVQKQVRTIDIMPTILALTRIKPKPSDGKSLETTWGYHKDGRPVEDAADRTGIAETDYPLRFGWAPLKSIRSDGMKYIEAPRPEFYELAKDPKELANSYEPWNQNVQKLRAVLADFRKSVAQQKSVSAGTVPQQTIDELKALGYLGSNPGATTAAEPSLLPDPKDKIQVQNLLHTAMLADEDNKPQAARQALEAALKLDPKTPAALVQLGQLELTEKHFSRAAELLAQARALRPEDATAAYDEGRARYENGDLAGARDALEASLKNSSGQFDARLLLGKVYARLQDWPKAQDQLEAAVFLDGKRPESRIELARVLLAEKHPQEALEQLRAAKEAEPNSTEISELMAEAQRDLGNEPAEKKKAPQ